jgi:hypothetical protein
MAGMLDVTTHRTDLGNACWWCANVRRMPQSFFSDVAAVSDFNEAEEDEADSWRSRFVYRQSYPAVPLVFFSLRADVHGA